MMGNPQSMIERIILLLINGMSASTAEAVAVQGGASADEARQLVADARRRITVAADFTRDEQLGKAVMRLEDLYAKSIVGKDIRTALQAQRELHRLLDLYGASGRASSGAQGGADEELAELRRQLELIEGYIRPLGLVDESYPIEEHARVAAELVRRGMEAQRNSK